MKGSDMELFNLEVSKFGVSVETYFGDVFLYHRAWLTALAVIVVLRIAKLIRNRNNQNVETDSAFDTDWSN